MTTYPTHSTDLSGPYARDIVLPGFKRTLWGAIMLGVVTAIGLQFIFTVLGMAIGITASDPRAAESSVRTVSMAAGAWWLITGTITLFVGGLALGWMSGLPRTVAIKIAGAAMWAVVALFGFAVIWTGAGMASAAASPIAIMSGGDLRAEYNGSERANSDRASVLPLSGSTGAASNPTLSDNSSRDNTARVEEARQAAQTAAWWSVFGLIAGLGASVAGACIGAGLLLKNTDVVASRHAAAV
jgi:hypothetical protein